MTDGKKAKLLRHATYASVSVAAILVISKAIAWYITHSVSLLSTLMDSILDTGASLITMMAVHHAMKPADDEHKFGHGKAEALAALLQSMLIAGSAIWLLREVTDRLLHPVNVSNPELGLAVLGLAIVLTFFLIRFQKKVIAQTGSMAIEADSMHYRTDIYINLSVVIALLITDIWDAPYVDSILGGGIAFFILRTSYQIGAKAFDVLMDRELPVEERERIIAIILANPAVLGLHDLRTRSTGLQQFIQCHVEIDGHMDLYTAHEIAEDLMKKVTHEIPKAEVLIHLDPPTENQRIY